MNKQNFLLLIMAILFSLTLLPFGSAAGFNVVSNGSFETGDSTDWNSVSGYINQTSLIITDGDGTDSYTFTPSDGSFFYSYNWNKFGAYSRPIDQAVFCSTDTIADPNEVIDLNLFIDVASYADEGSDSVTNTTSTSSYIEFLFAYLSPTQNPDIIDGSGNLKIPAGRIATFGSFASSGYANKYNTATLTNDGNTSYLCFTLGSTDVGAGSYGNQTHEYVMIDDIQAVVRPSIELSITEPEEPVGILDSFSISVVANDSSTNAILSNADMNLNISIGSDSNVDLNYSNGTWTYLNSAGLGIGNYTYTLTATGTGYNQFQTQGIIEVDAVLTGNLQITNISNTSYSIKNNRVEITPFTMSSDVEFKIENISADNLGYDVNYYVFNNLTDGRQYFVYTSTDGNTYTLNSTLTYGSNNYNPIQKIYDENNERYKYSFERNLSFGETQYIKLVYDNPSRYWERIGGSSDWFNRNPPSLFDDGFKGWDLFNTSSLTPIYSHTIPTFPDLTSSDISTGLNLIFTAYADKATDLNIGYVIGSAETITNINVGTEKQTFRVTIDPSDNNAQVFIGSGNDASARVYFTDFSLVPISYFSENMEIYDADGSELNTILNQGVNKKYINETLPFKFNTSFYNQANDLKSLLVEVLVAGTIVKTYEYDLEDYTGTNINFSDNLEGVLDYSSTSMSSFWQVNALKTMTIKAILVNNSDENVEEQFADVYLLQYPFFPNDFSLNIFPLNKKLGKPASFSFNLAQRTGEHFLGLDVRVYNKDRNADDPDYQTTIYKDELGCNNFNQCSKEVILDEYNYQEADNYYIKVGALLSTEPQNFSNITTYAIAGFSVSDVNFDTARILQWFERRDRNYTPYEPIPLVLQVKTDDLRNVGNEYRAVLQVDVNQDGNVSAGWGSMDTLDVNFLPQSFVYDPATAYNYWVWDSVFFDENGDLIDSGDYLRFKAYLIPLKEQKAAITAYGLTDKCVGYPSDFFNGSLVMDWVGFVGDATFGCTTGASKTIAWDSSDAAQIQIDSAYVPKAEQTQGVWCYRTDVNKTYNTELGDSFYCGVTYRKSEQILDGFNVSLGNRYSDYSFDDEEKQYVSFTISQEEAMFNDILMLRSALQTEYSTDEVNTAGEIIAKSLDDLLPFGQGFVDAGSIALGSGSFIADAGFDVNLSNQIDPNTISGIFFFKVNNMSVVNVTDYLREYPELEDIDPVYFRRFMNEQGEDIDWGEITIEVYGLDNKKIRTIKRPSTLVIFEGYSNRDDLDQDSNATKPYTPKSLKFDFIVDMLSNSQQLGQRAYIPITFSYVVLPEFSQFNFNGLIDGLFATGERALSDPVGLLQENWFYIVVFLFFIVVVSLVYRNFKGTGGSGASVNVYRGS